MIIQNSTAQLQKESAKLTLARLGTPDYSRMLELWELVDDCFAGELAIKAKGEKYIYRPESKRGNSKNAERKWEVYKKRGKFPNLPIKELKKSVGIICAKPPEITFANAAEQIAGIREYATPFRDGLDALFLRTVEAVLRYGRYCLLLEPDETERGFHINEYRPDKFIRAKVAERDGGSYAKLVILDTSYIDYSTELWQDVFIPELTLLAVTEGSEDRPGYYYQAKFGGEAVAIQGYQADRTPVYVSADVYTASVGGVLDALQAWKVDQPDPTMCSEFAIPTKYGRTLDRIPFTCVNASSLNFMRYENPPLLGQCVKCLHILNADCDHQQAVYMTTDPIPKFTGVPAQGEVKMSADNALYLGEGQNFDFAVAPASGLQLQADNIKSMLDEAKAEGVFLSGSEQVVNTSGYALQIQRNAATADLRQINEFCGKGIEEQLRIAGKWIGMDEAEVMADIKFTPTADFADIKPTMQEALAFVSAADKLGITAEERRLWAERNLGIEHRDWAELEAELDAEKLAELSGNPLT